MKKLILSLLILAFAGISTVQAQNLSKPKKGNAIRLKEYSLTIKQGEEMDIEMWVVKSKKYKLKLGEPNAKGKKGVNFSFDSKSEDPITYNVKIKVDNDAPTGDHMYVLKVPGVGRNAVKSTTVMIKVINSNSN